jgi:hypothetical protein
MTTGKSKTCVWRWQERFVEHGFDGPLRDKMQPSGVKPLGNEVDPPVVDAVTVGRHGAKSHRRSSDFT